MNRIAKNHINRIHNISSDEAKATWIKTRFTPWFENEKEDLSLEDRVEISDFIVNTMRDLGEY